MHTCSVLHSFLRESVPESHAARRAALAAAVGTVMHGARVSITTMGRGLDGPARIKHRIKRMDRLVGNAHLCAERLAFYRALAQRLVAATPRPLLLIDWSEFSADRRQQLLRAAVPVGGRALTVYEELHPIERLANRTVQHRFLDRLQRLLPNGCTPIVIADAGFRVPFFRYVERLGWHWLGRIRNRDFIRWEGAPQEWVAAKSLYRLATPRAQDLGQALWVRNAPLGGRLVLIRHPCQGRQDRSLAGARRRSRLSRRHAKRQREPWLLVASASIAEASSRQLVRLYKTRMQIEEAFRDTKSEAYGLGTANEARTNLTRAANLLLIAALAAFVLWIVGCLARARGWERKVHVSSSTQRSAYSALFLARLVIGHLTGRLPISLPKQAPALVANYLHSVWQT